MLHDKIELIELDQTNVDHLQTMYSVRTHPEVDCFLRGTPPDSYEKHINYLKSTGPHKKFYLVKTESALCGYCQLTLSEKHVEIGMALHPDHCNRGVGSRALSLLLTLLQNNEKIKDRPLILFVKKDNPRAIALYRKYGFESIGNENEHGEYLMQKL